MDTKQAILTTLAQTDFIVERYLADLSQQELLTRAVPNSNHIAWQLGHLISSERHLVDKAVPGRMDTLPEGFAEKHKKEASGSDDPKAFLSKDEYQRLAKQVRAGTLRIVESLSPTDLDRAVTGVPPFCKTVGDTLLFIGSHWMMHAGQWAIIRRKLGRPALF